MKQHDYKWDQVILGYNLSALIFAFYSGIPVIGFTSSAPWDFEKISSVNLMEFGMGKGIITHQVQLWEHLYMALSMGGQLPFSDNAESIRIDDQRLVITTSKRSKVIRGEFNKLWVFDDDKIQGLPDILERCEMYRVIDWFNVRSGMKHEENHLIQPSDDFVQSIYFYPSERIQGNHPDKKDLCAESFLHECQLDDFEYSPTYARFKIIDIMKQAGIRGTRNGTNSNGTPKHYSIKMDFDRRRIKRTDMHKYKDVAHITFNRVAPATLLKECLIDGLLRGRVGPANQYIPKVLIK